MNQSIIFLFCCLLICGNSIAHTKKSTPPKLTIIIVVDQCAFYYLQKLKKNFRYGLKRICDYGLTFHNAHFPHGKPETATGHAALNTGTFAKYHGFIGNNWFDQQLGKKVNCDFDSDKNIFVFDDPESDGKSARFLMVDGISDCFIARSNQENQYQVFSLSLKSRAAIAMAGHIKEPFGGAFWFQNNAYTTSNAFCSQIPFWITQHNRKKEINSMKSISWKPFYNVQSQYYDLVNKNTYRFSQESQFFDKTKCMNSPAHKDDSSFWYQASPQAITDLFDLAKSCISNNCNTENSHTLLWISLSGLDKLGHVFGPNSYETIDYLYHFDYALDDFLQFVKKEIGKRHFMCVFTADHGASSLPEIAALRGLPAKRISTTELKKDINTHIEQTYGIRNIIAHCNIPEIYIDIPIFNTVDIKTKRNVLQSIYTFLKHHEGIQWAWKTEILLYKDPEKDSFEDHFKKQIYQERSGDFIVQPSPFYTFTKYKRGSNHSLPYAADTHVPLIFYGPKYFNKKDVYDLVSPLQLAVTLALLFGVEIPSAAIKQPLPHIFSRDPLFDAF